MLLRYFVVKMGIPGVELLDQESSPDHVQIGLTGKKSLSKRINLEGQANNDLRRILIIGVKLMSIQGQTRLFYGQYFVPIPKVGVLRASHKIFLSLRVKFE
jgi:hypothetical protein